jgi:hypothetical protein
MIRIWRGLGFHGHKDNVEIAIWHQKNLANFGRKYQLSQEETSNITKKSKRTLKRKIP